MLWEATEGRQWVNSTVNTYIPFIISFLKAIHFLDKTDFTAFPSISLIFKRRGGTAIFKMDNQQGPYCIAQGTLLNIM